MPDNGWVMYRKMEYCERLAAKCAQRAEETDNEEEREFLYRMRDNWLQVAAGLRALEESERLREQKLSSDHGKDDRGRLN
jgi:hypothetical protein